MKKLLFVILISFHYAAFAQVGIGTQTPAPSAMLEVNSNDKGVLLSRMTNTERAAIANPIKGLMVFDTSSNSLWIHNGTSWVNTAAEATYGDVKSGFQTVDHSGWIKLDGRAVSSLTTTQKAAAASVGFTTNLPNATGAYLGQTTQAVNTFTGATNNTVSLSQANLPNVNFTGTSGGGGNHQHTVDPAPINSGWAGSHAHTISPKILDPIYGGGLGWGGNGFTAAGTTTTSTAPDHQHYIDIPSTNSSFIGDHFHSLSVASGGSNAAINITPKTLSVNMFVYLGN
jgi:hypothetical protein